MKKEIKALDNPTAVYILNTITRSGKRSGDYKTEITPELQRALKAGFGIKGPVESVTHGDLAREALLVLSEAEAYRMPLTVLLKGSKPEPFNFDSISTVALIAGALVALQTRVKIERDAEGNITVLFEKTPDGDALLTSLVKKMLGLLP
jgi:hypothetical protein